MSKILYSIDIGALDEKQLSQEEPEGSSDDEQVEPHNETDRKFMKMASDEAEKSPDKKVQVLTVVYTLYR